MFSLPNLAPTDSYNLWYTSSHSNIPQHTEPTNNAFDHTAPHIASNQNHGSRRQQASNRTPLARLRLDEEYIERRKQNVQNWGSSWIKPPGVAKSLHQLREEKREMEEHQEAMRREQLAQELAEAEQAEAEAMIPAEDLEGEMDGMVDLDDEIPDADETGMGPSDSSDASEDDEEDEENDLEDVPRALAASRMTDEAYRDAITRLGAPRGSMLEDDGASTIAEEEQSQMLQEEDLVHEHEEDNQDEDMEVDLDDDIPDADEGYEHTDTEDEIDSSEEESEAESLPAGNHGGHGASLVRSDGTQNSMDLSNLISHDSSVLYSSPRGAR
ncbi:uncharacterized protein EAE98_007925 [Botrytis deweyae]|uniref:Apc15p protein-domain-containing protein n=1 Tax=Botrytis deweyae TaxID=2478750 RepID=A0ABQ7IH77_9HELO|nr:uncharacterized protein EAE98_007925 [Botrytis deweyae]KAF7923220.1 hypothetical protein EAE98_007925 [Botrytis deweyae]